MAKGKKRPRARRRRTVRSRRPQQTDWFFVVHRLLLSPLSACPVCCAFHRATRSGAPPPRPRRAPRPAAAPPSQQRTRSRIRHHFLPTSAMAAHVMDAYEASGLARFPFEPYWPAKKLKICITGAGGFIASHLAKRLKREGHYIVACDWKRNEHMQARPPAHSRRAAAPAPLQRAARSAGSLSMFCVRLATARAAAARTS